MTTIWLGIIIIFRKFNTDAKCYQLYSPILILVIVSTFLALFSLQYRI